MKKYLVGVVAAAAGVALAMPATAQDDMDMEHAHMSIGGSFTQDFGFGSWTGGIDSESADDFHMDIGATLTFTGTGTTDGGLTATATVKLDADNGEIDESYLTIAGGFGEINVGSDDNASNMHGNKGTGSGHGGLGYYDTSSYTPASVAGPPNDGGDALGIRYSTPGIGGFQAGVSFQPETGAVRATTDANDSNIIAVGANFSGDFAGTSVTVGAGHVSLNPGGGGDTLKEWGLGTAIGIGDTTLSLRYDTKPDSVPNAAASGGMGDSTSFGIGVEHTMGALSFGIGYGTTTEENAAPDDDGAGIFSFTAEVPANNTTFTPLIPAGASVAAVDAVDRKHTILHVGAQYDLGGGVEVSLGISQGKVTNTQTGDPVGVCVIANTNVDTAGHETFGQTGVMDVAGDTMDGRAADGTCANGVEATYTSLKDLDDVGVGLRIAFSF